MQAKERKGVEKPDFAELVDNFEFAGDFVDATRHDSGHINETYVACFQENGGPPRRYILQRVNHHVFRNPEGVMRNIQAVTAHLRRKVTLDGGDPERETLNLVRSNGGICHKTAAGEYWRAYMLIDGANSYDAAESLEHVYNAARAFGRFQQLLSDFEPDQLYVTIPDFHDTPKRLDALVRAVERDARGRARSIRAEIDFCMQRAGQTSLLVDLLDRGELPVRVTHNDTKFNNVMIDDETGEGVCVIDLDTVMPGLSLYDFGDAVRSAANTAAEDERDLSKVHFDLDTFRHLTRGYLDAARGFLTPAEIDLLPFSARLMTLECGMRFLTDHLDGDVYFRIHRENHNLDRCRTQFKLVAEMEEQETEMEQVVETYR
jgi:hypothetical protein